MPSGTKPLIKVSALKKEYVNDEVITKALNGVDLEVEKGDFVAIMGPSGSGKSTLMHILGFLDKASSGKYFYKNKNVSNLSEEELSKKRNQEVGFVFQSYNLLPKTSVWDNVYLPLIYTPDINEEQKKKRVEQAIKSVKLEHRKNHLSSQLSGGEKQRVAIARALINTPSIIFADEPTGNLDSKTGQQILEIIQDLNDNGHTIIMVTHEEDTAKHAKRIIKIRDGVVFKDIRLNSKERRFAKNGELRK